RRSAEYTQEALQVNAVRRIAPRLADPYKRPARRGAGVVDRDGLENSCACKRTVGSNPTLSARSFAFNLSRPWLNARNRKISLRDDWSLRAIVRIEGISFRASSLKFAGATCQAAVRRHLHPVHTIHVTMRSRRPPHT